MYKNLEEEYLEFTSFHTDKYLYVYCVVLWQNMLEYSTKLYYLVDL